MAKKSIEKSVGLVGEVEAAPMPPVVSLDLKESLEMLKGVELVLDAIFKVMEDGKADLSDLTVLVDLAKQYEEFAKAVNNAGLIPAELKDLDQVEMLSLAGAIYPMLIKSKDIILKIKG